MIHVRVTTQEPTKWQRVGRAAKTIFGLAVVYELIRPRGSFWYGR